MAEGEREKKRKPQWEDLIAERKAGAEELGLQKDDCFRIVAVTRGRVRKSIYRFELITGDGHIQAHNIARVLSIKVTFDPREITIEHVPDPDKQ